MNFTDWKNLLLGAFVGAMLYGCGPGPNPPDQRTREEVISSAQPLKEPATKPITAEGPATEVVESYSGDRDWRCTVQKYSAAEAPQDFATFEPNAAVLWPGSLLQGATLESGAPEPIAVKRAGGTVLMNLLNTPAGAGAKSYQMKLTEMTQGNVIDAQNAILSNNQGGTPAAFDFESRKVDSQEELALSMHANVEWLSGSVDAKFKFSTDKRYTRYLLRLTQRYYTMVYETPTSLDGIFAPTVTGAELSKYVGPGNPATYVSSVTYGRQFYVLFESTSSAQELEAAISYVQNGVFVNTRVDAQANYKKVQSETVVHAFAIGGGAETALDAVLSASEGKLDGLRTFIVGGATVSGSNPGLPLSYQVRNVSDNKLVKVGVATEFVRKTCVPVIKNDGQTALWLDAQALTGLAHDQVLNTWAGRSTVQNDGIGKAKYRTNGINGHPAVWFNYDGSRWASFDVNLGAGAVVNTDYTVVGVIRAAGSEIATDPYRDYGHGLFLQGGSDWQNWNLHLGIEKAGNLVHGCYNYDLRSQSTASSQGDVLTFRFSKAEGKADSQNGVLRGTAPDQKTPLAGNPGARIGFNYLQPFIGYVGEVRVFSVALSALEQKTIECELGAKWSIGVAGCVAGKPDPAQFSY